VLPKGDDVKSHSICTVALGSTYLSSFLLKFNVIIKR
jgi:hypothetical protein